MKNLFKNKSFLILGGTGFIGTNLTNKLIKKRAKVTILSRHFKNTIPKSIFTIGDISNGKIIKPLIKQKFDVIVNCSGFSGEINCHTYPQISHDINFSAIKEIMDLIIRFSPLSKLILLGSRLEYGKAVYLPVDENHPTNPIGNYGKHKLKTTNYAINMSKNNNLKVTILRISNVFGINQTNKSKNYNIISNFINRAKNGQELLIYGDGKQLRDYIHIDKLTDIILQLSLSKKTNGEIYNLGSGKGISFESMVKKIAKKYNVNIRYREWPKLYKKYETGDFITNIKKIEKILKI